MAKKQQVEVEQEPTTAPDPALQPVGVEYTYVGGGEDSPRVIDFMGRQRFVRGQATLVTEKEVLAKVRNHPCFVEGDVSEEDLHDYDKSAKSKADLQRKQDMKTQSSALKTIKKWATGSDD